MKKKFYIQLAVAFLLMVLGNRVFNHVSAWGGIILATAGIVLLIITILNKHKPTNHEKEN